MIELNKVYRSDAIFFMNQLSDNTIDISLTSPSYNMGKRVKKHEQSYIYNNADNMKKEEYFTWISSLIQENIRITRFYFFLNISEVQGNKGIITHIHKNFGDQLKETFIWAKTNSPSHIVPTMTSKAFEYIFCFSKDTPSSFKYNYCNFNQHNGDYVRNCLIHNIGKSKSAHKYTFDEWLPSFFIKNFSMPGNVVFDCCNGSGSTCVAAKRLGRQWLGCDIVQQYVDTSNILIENTKIIVDNPKLVNPQQSLEMW